MPDGDFSLGQLVRHQTTLELCIYQGRGCQSNFTRVAPKPLKLIHHRWHWQPIRFLHLDHVGVSWYPVKHQTKISEFQYKYFAFTPFTRPRCSSYYYSRENNITISQMLPTQGPLDFHAPVIYWRPTLTTKNPDIETCCALLWSKPRKKHLLFVCSASEDSEHLETKHVLCFTRFAAFWTPSSSRWKTEKLVLCNKLIITYIIIEVQQI